MSYHFTPPTSSRLSFHNDLQGSTWNANPSLCWPHLLPASSSFTLLQLEKPPYWSSDTSSTWDLWSCYSLPGCLPKPPIFTRLVPLFPSALSAKSSDQRCFPWPSYRRSTSILLYCFSFLYRKFYFTLLICMPSLGYKFHQVWDYDFFLNWSIVDLPCCVSFWCTAGIMFYSLLFLHILDSSQF